MVNLVTAVNEKPMVSPLSLGDELFAVGSCFTDNIGELFQSHFYPLLCNPFGTVYHPQAMAEQLNRLLDDQHPTPAEIEKVGDLYVHDCFHGDYSGYTDEQALSLMNAAHTNARRGLLSAQSIIVTLGTAFGYRRTATGKIVANCHKRAANEFDRQLIDASEIAQALRKPFERLRNLNKRIIITVSPVRHVRDSLVDNQVSKAQLVTASHLLRQEYGDVEYFPAYEILLDELRDYRFYADDFAHPSQLARQILFIRFFQWAFGGRADRYFNEAETLQRRLSHRIQRPDSEAAVRFAQQTQHLWQEFKARHPFARRLQTEP